MTDHHDQTRLQRQRARYRQNKAAQRRRQREKIKELEQNVLALTQSLLDRKMELEELKTKTNICLLCQALQATSKSSTHTKTPEDIVTQFGELFKLGASQTVFWAKHARMDMSAGFLTQFQLFMECYHHTFYLAHFQLHQLNTQKMIRFDDGMVHMVLTQKAIERLHGNQLEHLEPFIGHMLKVPFTMDFYFDSNYNNCMHIEKVDWNWDWVRGFLPILSLKQISVILVNSTRTASSFTTTTDILRSLTACN